MMLSITTTHVPATDIGYLLEKNPARMQSFALAFGQAHVVYPEATPERCTAALVLDLDPVGLSRSARHGGWSPLWPYVNDRPYVASSFLSVAIAQVYGSALKGTSRSRPELAETPIPLVVELPVLPCRGGEGFLRRLFEPLGYAVEARRLPLDPSFPEWGDSPFHHVRLSATCRLADVLTHLYVLLPVLDNDKHYWVGEDEIRKLLDRGQGWLATHPERDEITRRYLKRQGSLVRSAMAAISEEDEAGEEGAEAAGTREEEIERPLSLHQQRHEAVVKVLEERGVRTVIELGCGDGKLLRQLVKSNQFERIAGMDASTGALSIAARRLRMDKGQPGDERIRLFQGALTYRDRRIAGYDAACLVEVIEHLEPHALEAFEQVVFGAARPPIVIVTTPNREYNALFPTLEAGRLRHPDHRFEWTRDEFRAWADSICTRFGYKVAISPLGDEDEKRGAPSQMGVFSP